MKYSLLVTIVATLPAASEGLHFCFNEVAGVTKAALRKTGLHKFVSKPR